MHHAHVLQGIEVTEEGRVICYNLGNFVLDWEEGNVAVGVMMREQNEGAVFLFDLDREGICLGAALPTRIEPDGCVSWATGDHGFRILSRLIRISDDLRSDYTRAFERQRAERTGYSSFTVLWHHLKNRHWATSWKILTTFRIRHTRLVLIWVAGLLRSAFRKMLP
jgi:hypothetical protein